ncbi:MAG: hypothetical protein K0U64_12130 [Actinomycetia bacterium]|nr:hypothetical protein [Actinomycetes bacterium]
MSPDRMRVFAFEFQKRYAPMLALLGITPQTSSVRITATEMVARFGPFSARSDLDNITCVSISGPYKPYKAIGARGSFADGGATFGSTTAGGVCMEFRKGITALDPTKKFKHKGLTVTVKEREEFAKALREAAGLPVDS